jgi:hypothetical protein
MHDGKLIDVQVRYDSRVPTGPIEKLKSDLPSYLLGMVYQLTNSELTIGNVQLDFTDRYDLSQAEGDIYILIKLLGFSLHSVVDGRAHLLTQVNALRDQLLHLLQEHCEDELRSQLELRLHHRLDKATSPYLLEICVELCPATMSSAATANTNGSTRKLQLAAHG